MMHVFQAERSGTMGVLKTPNSCNTLRTCPALAKHWLLDNAIPRADNDHALLVQRNSTPNPLGPLTSPAAKSAPIPSLQHDNAVKKGASVTAGGEPIVPVDPAAPQSVTLSTSLGRCSPLPPPIHSQTTKSPISTSSTFATVIALFIRKKNIVSWFDHLVWR